MFEWYDLQFETIKASHELTNNSLLNGRLWTMLYAQTLSS